MNDKDYKALFEAYDKMLSNEDDNVQGPEEYKGQHAGGYDYRNDPEIMAYMNQEPTGPEIDPNEVIDYEKQKYDSSHNFSSLAHTFANVSMKAPNMKNSVEEYTSEARVARLKTALPIADLLLTHYDINGVGPEAPLQPEQIIEVLKDEVGASDAQIEKLIIHRRAGL